MSDEIFIVHIISSDCLVQWFEAWQHGDQRFKDRVAVFVHHCLFELTSQEQVAAVELGGQNHLVIDFHVSQAE